MRATCNWNNNNKERRRYVYSSYFVVTTLTVVTLVPWPARTRYNERRRNKEMEIHPRSIQGTLHPRFQKSGKTNNFGDSRSSRIGGAGRQAHAKSRRNSTHGCQNRDVLGDRRGHTLDTETALSFQDDVSYCIVSYHATTTRNLQRQIKDT